MRLSKGGLMRYMCCVSIFRCVGMYQLCYTCWDAFTGRIFLWAQAGKLLREGSQFDATKAIVGPLLNLKF